jgi:flagellar basal-body rod modification protein FlgD
MADSVSALTGSASSNGTVPLVSSQKQLGQQDFLNLLVAQLKNQDPLKPVSNEGFIAQMAQFSQLEQTNKLVDLMQQSLDPRTSGRQFDVVSLIGRDIKLAGDAVTLGAGPASFGYDLAQDAALAHIDIRNQQGLLVRSISTGAQAAGSQLVEWDGQDQNGAPLPAGSYSVAVAAFDAQGGPVEAAPFTRARVTGLRMVNNEPQILIGSRIVRVDDIREVY